VKLASFSTKAGINAKITDFGTSRAVGQVSSSEGDSNLTKGVGTVRSCDYEYHWYTKSKFHLLHLQPFYMAPEVLRQEEYSAKADVYR
jgi:serine/threonine protein kinase